MSRNLYWAAPFILIAAMQRAQAVPAFSSQTGQTCSTCHVGAFGPELTAFGRNFKLTGYTLSSGAPRMPFSLAVQTTYTNTSKGQPGGAAADFGNNGNFAFDQINAFLAGRVTDNVGGFVQGTYSGIDHSFFLDNVDVRAVTDATVGKHDLELGVSVNNGPAVEDIYNSTYAWTYPFIASGLAPTPAAGTVLGGPLLGNTLGVVGYGSLDQSLLVAAGGYDTQAPGFMKLFGESYGPGAETGVAPYLRAAYDTEVGPADAHVGATFITSRFNPAVDVRTVESALGHDKYTDLSLDGGAQFLSSDTHQFTTNLLYTHEWRQLNGTTALGGAMTPTGMVDEARATATYYYNSTYGFTASWQHLWGSADTALYAQGTPVSGSANGKPNSNAYILETDYVPFGKDGSWAQPFVNLKIGLQYTIYTEFNGGSNNYDGFGRNASDNDTLYLFGWTVF